MSRSAAGSLHGIGRNSDKSESVRAIRESEYEECLDFWQTVWPDTGRPFYARYFYGDPDFQPEYTRVCVINGRIVSAAHICKRIVSCGELNLTIGGIANVGTLPDLRRRGYSTQCLRQAIQVMEADAMDFSLLFTGTHPLYEGVGWDRAPDQHCVGTLKTNATASFSNISVRHYEERDDAAIHLVHFDFNAMRPITVRRTDPYWREWIGWWRGSAPGTALVAEADGVVVGYCLYVIEKDRLRTRVREIGVRRGGNQAIRPLLEAAARDSLRHGITEMHVPLHANPVIQEAIGRLFTHVEFRPSTSAMIRLLHRSNLLRGMAPELTARWMNAGSPPGSLSFSSPYGVVSIESAGGFLRIDDSGLNQAVLSQADLFNLMFGRGVPAGKLSDGDALFAEALFPRQEPWVWERDGFGVAPVARPAHSYL